MTDAAGPIPPAARPRLAPGVRLQTDRVSGSPVLLYPEGMLQMNPTGAAIVELCDGRRSVADVVAALAQRFNAPTDVLHGDVVGYLHRLRQRGLLNLDAADGNGGTGRE